MVAREVVRSANEAFKNSPESRGLVALFVGATSGIAEYTLKSFARYTHSPRIYFAGRNEEAAARIQKETLEINPSASVTFIKTPDLTTLSAHDVLAEEFLAKGEKRLDVLVMSAGYLTLKGRDENQEGLDRKMTINYYGRFRLLFNLLPILRVSTSSSTSSTTPFTPSVLSILGSGRENPSAIRQLLSANNLDLNAPGTFGGAICEKATVTSTSLSIEELALREKSIRFAHVYPGVVVETGILREIPSVLGGIWKIFKPIVGAVAGTKVEDVGEGMVWLLHSGGGEKKPGSYRDGGVGSSGNLYLGSWDGEGRDYRNAKEAGVGGCKEQGKWEEERKFLRAGVWNWLGEVMGRVESERVKGLGLWSAQE